MRSLLYAVLCGYLLYTFAPIQYITAPLAPYIKEVKSIIINNCKPGRYENPDHQLIYFRVLGETTIGACGYSDLMHGFTIEIDPVYWLISDEADRFQLIAHEMTHCMLLLPHSEDKHSYMYPFVNPLSKQEVIRQMKEILNRQCNP